MLRREEIERERMIYRRAREQDMERADKGVTRECLEGDSEPPATQVSNIEPHL